jgi:2-polyprenyl-3-methyl-5-hydroxy-6-metoxy-1,4-benzoquinol methylase
VATSTVGSAVTDVATRGASTSVVPAAGTFACVVDSPARFHLDALRWYASLTRVVGVRPTDLVVHAVAGCRSDVLDYLEEEGVAVRDVPAFDRRSPHCNKISGALDLAVAGVDGLAVITDTDVVVLEDPRPLPVPDRAVAMKPVDASHPPLDLLTSVFAAAGLSLPPLWPIDWQPEESTVAGNGNGGFMLVPGGILSTVASAWERWARWLLERPESLGAWAENVDQVAMAMALASEGLDAHRLDSRWNFPTHHRHRAPGPPPEPAVIHYHGQVNQMGLLLRTGFDTVNRRIDAANAAITEIWHDAFPNATFWEWRYTEDPGLGSGVGSRGQPLADKRELLLAVVDILHPRSVLDVGCGDGEATAGLPLPGYIGLDLSPEAVNRARAGRPDGDFRVGTLADHALEADLTLCLDVLIHQADRASYRASVKALVASARRALIVSGYQDKPATRSPMVHFHEPLSVTLAEFAPDSELYPLRENHGMTTYLVLRAPAMRHRRDFQPATLAQIARRHPNVLRLLSLRLSAWETIGFFPDQLSRLWEYPTTVDLLVSLLGPGVKVVDVGAGVNPLVPYLTARGYEVHTVDPSTRRRDWSSQREWNEWGFLDYAEAKMAHRSWNCTLDQLPAELRFDAAYCLGVIEHLPAEERRKMLHDIAARLRPGGVAILAVELLRGRDALWNRSGGQVVESARRHGGLRRVVREARRESLEPSDVRKVRNWGDSPVDIGLIVMHRRTAPVRAGMGVVLDALRSRVVALRRGRGS